MNAVHFVYEANQLSHTRTVQHKVSLKGWFGARGFAASIPYPDLLVSRLCYADKNSHTPIRETLRTLASPDLF